VLVDNVDGKMFAIWYNMIVRGGAVTDRISGGVLAHESLSPVQAYKMLILHYSTKLGVQEVVAEPTRPFGPADLQCEIASGCGNM